jgi:hypothetical protein
VLGVVATPTPQGGASSLPSAGEGPALRSFAESAFFRAVWATGLITGAALLLLWAGYLRARSKS